MSNYYKPTPKKWRIFGDFLLMLIPVVTVIFSNAPNLSEVEKYWWVAGCNIFLVAGKFLTNTFKAETTEN